MQNLVIVESPAKAKTIKKYLGSGFEVMASMGHIRDLPKSKLGIDFENGFLPQYQNMADKKDIIKKLKAAASESDKVYLATDPDREGEAISWHLATLLGLSLDNDNRVTFDEITAGGIKSGMSAPRKIDINLVDAQQARRVLDRIVGYKISPFLWRKIKKGLSAGRVQSVAVKLIVDREREIESFEAEEYWSIEALLSKLGKKTKFSAKLSSFEGKKPVLGSREDADKILCSLEGAEYIISDIKKGKKNRHPAPPFTTSTMQQEGARKLGFQAKRTMKAAQELYEGIDLKGHGTTGLITYMRTDSLRISDEARAKAKAFITENYVSDYYPEKPNFYKSKGSAQDAHEAIRPADPGLTPVMVKESLTSDQFKLYNLIWSRFMASQMKPMVQSTVAVVIKANAAEFKATGYTTVFDGFAKIYQEGKDEKEEKETALPPLEKDEKLELSKLSANQHFTEPPARYTEASLIKALEENGIGRPSTYAPTITTIMARAYVEREGKTLRPTGLGTITTGLLEEQFSSIVDVKFTAGMELKLDGISEGKVEYKTALEEFYSPFDKMLKEAETNMEGTHLKIPDIETDEICENCGRKMVIKEGRFGKFLACPGYPECKNTRAITTPTDGFCPKCSGKMIERKSKKGKVYFACEKGKECGFMTWDVPLKSVCPECGSSLFKRKGKDAGIYCLKESCGYKKEKK